MDQLDQPEQASTRDARFVFSGNTGDYFRIWIVNIALTVVTIGFYSPWAKVRRLRYFYTNTSVEDGHFDYHAKPESILIGRVIAVAVLALYWFSGQVSIWGPLVVIGLIALAVPWLVVRTRSFQLRNTSFNGIRFNFQRNYKDAFKAYYGGALITAVSFGLAGPTAIYWRNKFTADNAGYGKTRFQFNGGQGEFYAIFWRAVGLGILGGIIASFMLMMTAAIGAEPKSPLMVQVYGFLFSLPILMVYAAIGIYVLVRQRNYVWCNTTLGETSFFSSLSASQMALIYGTNILAIIFSFGLAIPWAQIRLAKYRAECMQAKLASNWDEFVASEQRDSSALAEEIGEAFDVEIDVAF